VSSRFVLKIAGMNAVHAVRAVETSLRGIPGVLDTEVTLGGAVVTHDGRLRASPLRDAVRDAGFEITEILEDRRHRLPLIE
jgi:copper chaperone CopZ